MSSKESKPRQEEEVQRASPMADDKTLKAMGHVAERRRSVGTVRMKRDKTEMDVSALDVEAHARMGWKVVAGGE